MGQACQECEYFSLKKAGRDMGNAAFGICVKSKEPGLYMSATYPRECCMFATAQKEVVEARKKFLQQFA